MNTDSQAMPTKIREGITWSPGREGRAPLGPPDGGLNPSRTRRFGLLWLLQGLSSSFLVLLLAGCATPIGADRVTTRQAYAQVEANALRDGKPSAVTAAILHRYDLDRLAARQPDEAVRQLHRKALATGERDLLFALAELSYTAADQIRRSLKPWDLRDAREYYLGSAVYAWLFLFGESKEAPPTFLDPRLRTACEFYNYGLGLALTEKKSTNAVVQLQAGTRRLPVGAIALQLNLTNFPIAQEAVEQFLLTDQFRVHGLSVRNREPGIGAPLLAVRRFDPELGVRRCAPATLVLRLPGSLAAVDAGTNSCPLELYSPFSTAVVTIGRTQVPLETDFTTYMAYVLNQSFVWKLGMRQFLAPSRFVRSRLIPLNDFEPNRIPLVFVHGTFSSPVTYAELNNSLAADPVLRERYQVWSFIYGSGNALPVSAAELRDALTAKVQQLDPEGTNALLRQMVIIGHSQGGLLTKLTATQTGDKIWRAISDKPLEEFPASEEQRARLRRLLFLEPLPFVSRVIFISTPHRGSYLASNFARRLASKLMSLPSATVRASRDAVSLSKGDSSERFLNGKLPTSLDSMSPKNPGLLALADIPVAPTIKAHSIIPVKGEGDLQHGRDGVVAYTSAHVDYVESELVVRGPHSCQSLPATIEEVRRILHEHLRELKDSSL
jgi:pimeloyl-ACP methyl ester carboxylesterase